MVTRGEQRGADVDIEGADILVAGGRGLGKAEGFKLAEDLAAGISGAIQHKVGMQGSENIVAINKDSNAPIFEFSDLGIVGDLNKILPKLTEAVKAKKGS